MAHKVEELVLPRPCKRPQKWDSAYWRPRLKEEAPGSYVQLMRGEIQSVMEQGIGQDFHS